MEIEVVWNDDALLAIRNTFDYVKQFSLQNALKLALDLIEFGNGLNIFPEKYKRCAKPSLRRRNFRCVTHRMHIFVYKVVGNRLRIYKVFHAKQNPKKMIVR